MTSALPTSVRLPADVDARLTRAAKSLGASKSEVIREVVVAELDRLEWEAAIRERAATAGADLDALRTLEEVATIHGVTLGDPDMSLLDDVQ